MKWLIKIILPSSAGTLTADMDIPHADPFNVYMELAGRAYILFNDPEKTTVIPGSVFSESVVELKPSEEWPF